MMAGSSESLVLHLEVLLWPRNGDVVLMAMALKVAGNSLTLPGVHMPLLSHHQTLHTYHCGSGIPGARSYIHIG